MAKLIDTSVLIAMERSGQPFSVLAEAYRGDTLAIAAITASEMLTGIYRSNTTERSTAREGLVESVLAKVLVEPFDLTVARIHARLWAQLTSGGEMIGAHDLLIAATAVALEYEVLTHNLREFGRVPGPVVQQPSW